MKGWGAYIVIALAYFGYNVMTSADRDATGAIIDGGSVDAFSLRVGDCFDDVESTSDQIGSLPAVPCSEPHDNEIYALVNVELPEFPGDDVMGEVAQESCIEHFESFVGRDYATSALDIYPLFPSQQSWDRMNDREVVCAVYDIELEKLVGSVQGQAL